MLIVLLEGSACDYSVERHAWAFPMWNGRDMSSGK